MVSNHLRSPNFRSWLTEAWWDLPLSHLLVLPGSLNFTSDQTIPDPSSYLPIATSFAKIKFSQITLYSIPCYNMLTRSENQNCLFWALWISHSWEPAMPVGESESKSPTLKLTTNVLTATTLEYTIGAGITAGAGTRLFLQLLLW